jgi:AraC-like DNA-binding protein
MLYRDYVISAISLLVVALIFAGIRVRKYNFPYLYFLVGVIVASFLFTDPALVGDSFVQIFYPLFVPFLFMVGPGLYGSVQAIEERRRPWHIIHYLPLIIGFTQIFLHWFISPDHYYQAVTDGRDFLFLDNFMFYPFSDAFIILGYSLHAGMYFLLTMWILRRNKAPWKQYILPAGMLASVPVLFDVTFEYVYGYTLLLPSPEVQRYILVVTVLIIVWDITVIKPPKPKEASAKEPEEGDLLHYPDKQAVKNVALLDFLAEFVENDGPTFAKILQSRTAFVRASKFSKDEWEIFFAETRTSWNFLKKFVRIQKAIALMEEGFLSEGNVDELAIEVGYSTRASLYLAFRQIMGVPLPEYRLEREY